MIIEKILKILQIIFCKHKEQPKHKKQKNTKKISNPQQLKTKKQKPDKVQELYQLIYQKILNNELYVAHPDVYYKYGFPLAYQKTTKEIKKKGYDYYLEAIKGPVIVAKDAWIKRIEKAGQQEGNIIHATLERLFSQVIYTSEKNAKKILKEWGGNKKELKKFLLSLTE